LGTRSQAAASRIFALAALAALAACPALAQSWGAGASAGAVNDVSRRLSVDEFHSQDWNAWAQFELEDRVQLRGTYGSLRTRAAESGQPGNDSSGGPLIVPVLTSHVDYGTLGVSYEFFEGDFTSGLFAGIGVYKVRPNDAPAGFEDFRDPRRTVFGWHAGADAAVRIVSKLSLVGRLTLHRFKAGTGRSILTTDAGFLFRF
jgi:hypothetical protein